MTTTLVPPRSGTRSASSPTHEPREDCPIGAITALRREVETQRRPRYIERRRRPFWLDAARRDAVLGSTTGFLVSLAIAWVLSGVIAYFYALWTLGPVS
jgi:hypothetical protein